MRTLNVGAFEKLLCVVKQIIIVSRRKWESIYRINGIRKRIIKEIKYINSDFGVFFRFLYTS